MNTTCVSQATSLQQNVFSPWGNKYFSCLGYVVFLYFLGRWWHFHLLCDSVNCFWSQRDSSCLSEGVCRQYFWVCGPDSQDGHNGTREFILAKWITPGVLALLCILFNFSTCCLCCVSASVLESPGARLHSDSEGWEDSLSGCSTGCVIKSKCRQDDTGSNRLNTSLSDSLSPFSSDLITSVTPFAWLTMVY